MPSCKNKTHKRRVKGWGSYCLTCYLKSVRKYGKKIYRGRDDLSTAEHIWLYGKDSDLSQDKINH